MLVEYHSNHWMFILFKGADVCTHDLKTLTMEGFERMFNRGDVGYADTAIATEAVDHQEPLGASFPPHLKNVVTTLRTGLPRPPLRGAPHDRRRGHRGLPLDHDRDASGATRRRP